MAFLFIFLLIRGEEEVAYVPVVEAVLLLWLRSETGKELSVSQPMNRLMWHLPFSLKL